MTTIDGRADSGLNYKLTEAALTALVPTDSTCIVAAAAKRKTSKWARHIVRVFLNQAKTVWVQNVRYYGGENFGKPYHFPAEIRHATTESAFRRCVNRLGLRLGLPFTY